MDVVEKVEGVDDAASESVAASSDGRPDGRELRPVRRVI